VVVVNGGGVGGLSLGEGVGRRGDVKEQPGLWKG
jgi:hypothetical protein